MLCGYGYADFYWVSRRLMSDSVIRVEGLSKKYVLGHQSEGRSQYKSLRDVVADGARSMFRRKERSERDEFWALRDVDFEIRQGDRVGIIGRNGAGKSTLLKVLSRIVEPTTGRIGIKGRVASLLEVGTGFHPELTGRENIFLNGAILGMSRREIDRKFDEIVAFAEVERFLDTPVKRYSSGMYVRLAFAVAAHLEPEILIVDEVLAVGDAQFQKKCLGKMEDVGKEGRTVIFVSHQMGTITQLCNKGIYLKQGSVVCQGSINETVKQYVMTGSSDNGLVKFSPTVKKQPVFCKQISISSSIDSTPTGEVDIRYPFYINLDYEVIQAISNIEISVRISTADGRAVFTTNQSDYSPSAVEQRSAGMYRSSIEVPGMFLMPGSYLVQTAIHEPMVRVLEEHDNVISFTVLETGTKFARYNKPQAIGVVIQELQWRESETNGNANRHTMVSNQVC
jgi:lipopolysaccharide transport system ATP-binding protein